MPFQKYQGSAIVVRLVNYKQNHVSKYERAKLFNFFSGLLLNYHTKGSFYSESAICFSNVHISKKKYSKLLPWAWNLNLFFTVIGRKSNFQVQDGYLEYFVFGDLGIWKTHLTFWKKPLLIRSNFPKWKILCVKRKIYFSLTLNILCKSDWTRKNEPDSKNS